MMAYVGLAIAGVLFFTALHRFTNQTMRMKLAVTVALIVLIGTAVVYEQSTQKERERINALRFAFDHNQTIVCDGVEVGQDHFSYSVRSFIGKKNSPHYGRIFDLLGCEIRP